MDLVTCDGGRRVPTDSGAPVEGGSDCSWSSFRNFRLTIEGDGGDRAPEAHKADDDDGIMHFAYVEDEFGGSDVMNDVWVKCWSLSNADRRCCG